MLPILTWIMHTRSSSLSKNGCTIWKMKSKWRSFMICGTVFIIVIIYYWYRSSSSDGETNTDVSSSDLEEISGENELEISRDNGGLYISSVSAEDKERARNLRLERKTSLTVKQLSTKAVSGPIKSKDISADEDFAVDFMSPHRILNMLMTKSCFFDYYLLMSNISLLLYDAYNSDIIA